MHCVRLTIVLDMFCDFLYFKTKILVLLKICFHKSISLHEIHRLIVSRFSDFGFLANQNQVICQKLCYNFNFIRRSFLAMQFDEIQKSYSEFFQSINLPKKHINDFVLVKFNV